MYIFILNSTTVSIQISCTGFHIMSLIYAANIMLIIFYTLANSVCVFLGQ